MYDDIQMLGEWSSQYQSSLHKRYLLVSQGGKTSNLESELSRREYVSKIYRLEGSVMAIFLNSILLPGLKWRRTFVPIRKDFKKNRGVSPLFNGRFTAQNNKSMVSKGWKGCTCVCMYGQVSDIQCCGSPRAEWDEDVRKRGGTIANLGKCRFYSG